jgi:putative peptidoglycan lipid II flippase
MLSRVFGLARDTAFAVLFGTGFIADAFNLAFLLPNFFRRVVGEGNLNPAYVPVFTEVRERQGAERAGQFYRHAHGMLLVLLAVMTLLGIAFAGPLVSMYAGDWESHPEDFAFAVRLLRVLFPSLLFAGGAALSGATLNAYRHFSVPALSPILLNVCFLLGAGAAVLGWETLEARVLAFSVGGLVGGAAAWFVQFPKLKSFGIPLLPGWGPRDPDVRRVAKLMLPGIVALGVTQLILFVDTLLALGLEEGALTALRLGNRVTLLPLGVIGIAVSTASLPTLALKAAALDRRELLETVAHTLRLLLTLLIPAAVGLILMAKPIVTLLFQYGQFSAERSTPMTAGVLLCYAFGVPAFGLVKVLSSAYYSVQDTVTPVKIASVAVVVNIVLDFAFMIPWGLNGLALATGVASWLNVVLLLRGVTKRVGPLPEGSLRGAMARILAASGALALAVLAGQIAVQRLLPGGAMIARLGQVGVPIVLGLAAMIAAYRFLGHPEMREVLESLPGRRKR